MVKKNPFWYMHTHMFIMPVIDFYATVLDWINEHTVPSEELYLFLIISFSNGIVLEMGRKIRAKDAEEVSVETFSALIGEKRATLSWISIIMITFAIETAASILSGSAKFGIPLLVIFASVALFYAIKSCPENLTVIHLPFTLYKNGKNAFEMQPLTQNLFKKDQAFFYQAFNIDEVL